MNLKNIGEYLNNLLDPDNTDNYIKQKIKELVLGIRAYEQKRTDFESEEIILKEVIYNHTINYMKLMEELLNMEGSIQYELKYINAYIDKLQAITTELSILENYIMELLTRDLFKVTSDSARDSKKSTPYTFKIDLEKKQQFYKSQSILLREKLQVMRIRLTAKRNDIQYKRDQEKYV